MQSLLLKLRLKLKSRFLVSYRLAFYLLGSCLVASTAAFADDHPVETKIAITGAKVYTMAEQGVLEIGTVLIRNGEIEKVIPGDKAPEGYNTITANGKVVTPGLIAVKSSLGLVEVGMSAGIVDSEVSYQQPGKLGTTIDSQYAINMQSSLINITRVDGVTTAATGVESSNTLFQGMGSVISLGDKVSPIIKAQAYMSLNLAGAAAEALSGSRASLWPELLRAFAEAASLQGRQLNIGQQWHGEFTKSDINALIPVLNGDMPLFVTLLRAADIRRVLQLKARYRNIKLVLIHATEAWMVASEIAAAKVPVVLNPEANLPYDFDELGATIENAARLSQAGVKVSISNISKYGSDSHNMRLITQLAGNAVANGMPYEAALAAITINSAEILSVAHKVGSLSEGKQADVVVWNGDPLEVMHYAEVVIINGELIPMESRQTKLRDRYETLQSEQPYRYVKP